MGAWGEYPLENDTALDLMSYLSDVDADSMGRMIGLMLNSQDDLERTLGIFLVDVYYNGITEDINQYDFNDFFTKLHKDKNVVIEFYHGLVWDALEESIKVSDKWKDKEARIEILIKIKERLKRKVK